MSLNSRRVLGMRVDATSCEDASRRVLRWAHDGRSAYVCVATVHMTMETFDSVVFRQVVNRADLVMPDGRPLVWTLRSLGIRGASQVRGTDLKTHVSRLVRALELSLHKPVRRANQRDEEAIRRWKEERWPELKKMTCKGR
jgi:UDP-N-acetyl-D-mannosaminuronic acid transferase (WecB/TagA/CpsF family)